MSSATMARRPSMAALRTPPDRSVIATKLFFLALVTTVFMIVLTLRFIAHGGGEVPHLVRGDLACPPCSDAAERATAAGQLRGRAVPRPADHTTLPRALYEAVQRDPELLKHPVVAEAFLPTPWLLPAAAATAEVLPYLGLHNDLDALLKLRAAEVGEAGEGRAVSVVYFSGTHVVMMQNWVYTAVKWASITNYIVATWEEDSLAACIAMHLPCLNATAYLPLPLEGGGEVHFGTKSFAPVAWVKPLVAEDIVRRGFYVHSSDVDIAFPPKAFWPSMLRFLEPSGADVAMERDLWGPINTGCVVVRPTKYGKAFMKAWASHAKEDSLAGTDDQGRAMSLGDHVFRTCEGPWDCARMKEERREQLRLSKTGDSSKRAPTWALLRRYYSGWDSMWQDHCTGAHLDWASPIDPCMPPAVAAHLICISGAENKIRGFKATGFWFLDESGTAGCTKPPPGEEDGLDAKAAAAFAARFVKEAEGRRQQHQRGMEGVGVDAGSVRRRVLEEGRQQEQQVQNDESDGTDSRGGVAEAAAGAEGSSGSDGSGSTYGAAAAEEAAGATGSRELVGDATPAKKEAVARCQPLFWREPRAEDNFLFCDKRQLSWVYYPSSAELNTV